MRIASLAVALIGFGMLTAPAGAATAPSGASPLAPAEAQAGSTYERIALGNANQPSRQKPQYGQTSGGRRGRYNQRRRR